MDYKTIPLEIVKDKVQMYLRIEVLNRVRFPVVDVIGTIRLLILDKVTSKSISSARK